MAGITSLTNIWENVKEVDLRPIREEALQLVRLAVAGRQGSGRQALVQRLQEDPIRPEMRSETPLPILDLDDPLPQPSPELLIVLVAAQADGLERSAERVKSWSRAGTKVLVLVKTGSRPEGRAVTSWMDWGQSRVLYGDPQNTAFLLQEFAPVVMEMLPERLTALARFFPLFRSPVAHHLINETSFANAAYSLSTGLAEIVPVFNIPLNVADMVVLTKAQAFLVYRLGLALGMSTEWQDYIGEFGGVLGGGFLWRQMARSLVGLIPAWGIVPKVAIAYAGTYVVGTTVHYWYTTGRHISREQMNDLYRQAFARGKVMASNLVNKIPRPRLRRRKPPALPLPKSLKALPAEEANGEKKICPECGETSAVDAAFCQYCGHPFLAAAAAGPEPENGET